MDHTPFGILFVCTGNICRSPTAEAVFRHKVRALGLESRFLIDSAGTHDYHVGDPPDPRATETARRRGVLMDDLRARKIRGDDFKKFDLILAMDEGHFNILSSLRPLQAKARLAYFLNHIGETGADVPDPYYGGQSAFDLVFDMVNEACDRILADWTSKKEDNLSIGFKSQEIR